VKVGNSDISIILQGGLDVGWDVRYSAAYLREVFPGATLILSTQKTGAETFEGMSVFDKVVFTDDPGSLPSVKFGGPPHNVNRQIVSAAAGMAAVTTAFAMKLRTDAYLDSRKVVDLWQSWGEQRLGPGTRGRARILITSIFSLNPRFDERLVYHLSDFIQFGRSEDLQKFWSCPLLDFGTGTWYERNDYASGSLRREKQFRSRFATEQWLTLNYLYGPANFPIEFHNHTNESIITEFENQMVDNFVVAHPFDIDLRMPKHGHFFRSRYFNAICHSFESWRQLAFQRAQLRGPDIGYTQWPKTIRGKQLFLRTKNSLQWLSRIPGARSTYYRFSRLGER
jgi:hypothetical protein